MPSSRELSSRDFFSASAVVPTLSLFSILLFYLFFLRYRLSQWFPSEIHHRTLYTAQYLLGGPPKVAQDVLLQERADANERLANALGLTNTFVNPGLEVHTEFVRHSRRLLKEVQGHGWSKFRSICIAAVRSTLGHHSRDGTGSMDFDLFVQVVVLRTMLAGFLDTGRDVDELEQSCLVLVATRINQLWTLSKSPTPPPSYLITELHEHLRLLLPEFENPIDFVIPVWETSWRVCATVIAHVLEKAEYRSVFAGFSRIAPISNANFETVTDAGFTIKDFIEETLRLHPPVKHISRVCTERKTASFGLRAVLDGQATREVADIQAILLSTSIWPKEPDVFNPWRHRERGQLEELQRQSLKLVFGHGALRCIAASWAPMAAAVICAAVLEGIDEAGWYIVPKANIGGRQGWDGWKVTTK